jgi:hypothetical protein
VSEPDLSAIVPPEKPPSDVPDEKTKAEEQQLNRKPPSAVEREVASHHAHISALHTRIDVHCGEIGSLKDEARGLRQEVKELQATLNSRDVRIKELEVANAYGGCLAFLGNLMMIFGGVAISVAGALPMSDQSKAAVTGIGTGGAVAGLLVVIAVYGITALRAWIGHQRS